MLLEASIDVIPIPGDWLLTSFMVGEGRSILMAVIWGRWVMRPFPIAVVASFGLVVRRSLVSPWAQWLGVWKRIFGSLLCVSALTAEFRDLYIVECYTNHIITPVIIHTAGLAFGGTGLCSYRVRGVDGSCAKHLTVESYTVVMLLTFILIIMSIPSPLTLHSRLKTLLFCKSFPP